MRDDLDKRLSLVKRFDKLMSLGLWSDKIPQPDPQVLERIQRLNNDIMDRIVELYTPEGQQEEYIKGIKQDLYQESQNRTTTTISKKSTTRTEVAFSFLGDPVSSWLNDYQERTETLEKLDLPSIKTVESLGDLLNTTPKRLAWLCYHERITKTLQYEDFVIPKGNSTRIISKPSKTLQAIHNIIKQEILDHLKFESFIHGFRKRHNIFDNAREHVNCRSLISIDIEDFFGTTTFFHVRQAFHRLGYSKAIATFLALLTTKQEYTEIRLKDQIYWSCSKRRFLPQGASTSPAISNLVASRFDQQMYDRARKLGFIYTRYADDLTFSTTKDSADHKAILFMARRTLELHGYRANPSKTKILFPHHQQKVTGLNVNSGKVTVPRRWRKRLRAAVHQFRFIEDPELQEKEYHRIMGSIQHLKLSHPRKAQQYQIEIDRYYKV